MVEPAEVARRTLTQLTHRLYSLPVVVLMPHSRCNCRCVMCDIWKANHNKRELSRDDLAAHLPAFHEWHVQHVVLSGGEALMHSNLWTLCALLKELPVTITLLSTGLLLERHAADVARWCDDVIVSLDGSRAVHDAIRNVPNAFDRLAAGVAALKAQNPAFRVTGRCVLQRRNFRDLPAIIAAAHTLSLDQISFLSADVSSEAFNRPAPWDGDRAADVALSRAETADFATLVEEVIASHATDFASGFIAETPDKLRRLPQYYAALHGVGDFPPTVCNAPWVSTVIEADGTVRPCFFHRPLGNLHQQPLADILNSPEAIAFRRNLDVTTDPICRKCVCTLHLGRRTRA
ncbi:MAG: SPASM domain-containing protein [Thermomicrobiales bacterium]